MSRNENPINDLSTEAATQRRAFLIQNTLSVVLHELENVGHTSSRARLHGRAADVFEELAMVNQIALVDDTERDALVAVYNELVSLLRAAAAAVHADDHHRPSPRWTLAKHHGDQLLRAVLATKVDDFGGLAKGSRLLIEQLDDGDILASEMIELLAAIETGQRARRDRLFGSSGELLAKLDAPAPSSAATAREQA